MTLLQQRFLSICLFLLLAFTVSFVANLESSRDQTVAQLRSHAQDAATALGVALTPHIDDPVTLELMVASIFDSGYFASIRVLRESDGAVLSERRMTPRGDAVPAWFARLVDLRAEGGEALIQRGWHQAARVEVLSHPQFALARLWQGALGSLTWLALCGLLSIALGGWLLQRQLRPLELMVQQAEAIGRRTFVSQPLPHTPELRRVVLAMNQMADKLRSLFAEEAAHSERLRNEAYQDSLSGLANRRLFDMRLDAQLLASEQNAAGYLLLLHLNDLDGLNQRLGAGRTDALIMEVGERLQQLGERFGHPDWLAARCRGGEFALLAPGASTAEIEQLAGELGEMLAGLHATGASDSEPVGHVGLTSYRPGESRQTVLSRADQALALARQRSDLPWARMEESAPSGGLDQHDWRHWLDDALAQGRLQLHFQPVVCSDDASLLHHKVLARLLDPQGTAIPAGQFLPWIARLGWGARLDRLMLEHVLEHLQKHPHPLAMSLSAASLNDPVSLALLLDTLRQHPQQAGLLTLELDERALPGAELLPALCQPLRDTGYGLAVQHFGGRFSLIGNLAHLGLAWLKIDGSHIHGLDLEADKCVFIEAIRRTTHNIDLPLIAEMVESEGEAQALRKLGVHGMMGRWIGEPEPWTKGKELSTAGGARPETSRE